MAILVAMVAICVAVVIVVPTRVDIPPHLINHPIIDLENFLSEQTVDDLLQLTRDFGTITTAAREYDSYKVLRDNIGEAVPFNTTSNSCPHAFLMPNGDKSMCVFPGRVDVGRHYVMSGGIEGLKESYDTLVSRVQPFQKYMFDYPNYPVAKQLLESPEFQKLALGVCPSNKQYLDAFQVNLIAQVPGQTVASHIDAPYFMRASRFHFPQWYLATMVFSGLFQEEFVDQVQVVAYYHKWSDSDRRKGIFYFWNDDSGVAHQAAPLSRSANSVDGSKVIHAAAVYRPDQTPPILKSTASNELRYRKGAGGEGHLWDLVSDDKVLRTYPEDDLRFSVVYRARCFENNATVQKYKKLQDTPMTLDEANSVFRADLARRGVLALDQEMSPFDFGLLLLKTYVKYPLSATALIPFNYCALDRVYPILKPLLAPFC